MSADERRFGISNLRFQICVYLCASAVPLVFCGCGKPNAANIELRKQNQQLTQQIEDLDRRHQADVARIRTLESQQESLPTLPQERLDKLFTTHGIRFGKLTGGFDADPKQPGDEAVKIYLVPFDAQGNDL